MKLLRKTGFRQRQQGFTLIELMITSALFLLAMSVLVNFIFQFNRTGNRTLAQSTMEEQLRNTLNRLEKELIEGSQVLVGTTKNKLVLAVPIYTANGFILVNNAGTPITNTLTIEAKPSTASNDAVLRKHGVKPDQLLLSLTPVANSNRTATLTNQRISGDLVPKHLSGTNLGNYLPVGTISPSEGTFKYFDAAGGEVNPSGATQAQLNVISQIKVTLWGEKDFYEGIISSKKELEVRLRNWDDDPSN